MKWDRFIFLSSPSWGGLQLYNTIKNLKDKPGLTPYAHFVEMIK